MKKKDFFPIFLIFLLFVLPLAGSSVVSGNPPPLLTTSSPPFSMKVGSGASEEEQIDSMDVSPANRWDVTNTGFAATMGDGLLHLSDVGDGTVDSYSLARDLRDLEGQIEIRFRYEVDTGDTLSTLGFKIWIRDKSDSRGAMLNLISQTDDGYAGTNLLMYLINGSIITKELPSDEKLRDNIWYKVKINYDVLKSKLRFRCYYDNGTEIFDHTHSSISAVQNDLFKAKSLELFITQSTLTNNKGVDVYLDYIKAPFKVKSWDQAVTPSDSDWITDSPHQAYVEDDIDEYSAYQLVVPFFDHCSGSIFLRMDNIGNEVDADNCDVIFKIYGVDADDGGVHEIYEIKLHYGYVAPSRYMTVGLTTEQQVLPFFVDSDTASSDDNMRLDFDIGTYDDRSKLRVNTRHYIGEEDNEPVDVVGQATLSATVSDPSNEFIVKIFYYADFSGNQEFTGKLENFVFVSKDIFQDAASGLLGGIWNFIADIFIIVGKFLAGIFKFIGDIIVTAVQALEPLLTAISSAITAMQTALGTAIDAVTTAVTAVVTELQGLAAAIATAVWDGIGTALDFITEAVEGIWTAMVLILDDVIAGLLLLAEDIGDFLFAILEFLIALIDEFFDLMFVIWDSVPLLVGISDVVDLVFTSFMDILTAAPDLFSDVMAWVMFFGSFIIIIWWFWAFFLSFAETNFNPFEGMGNFIEKCFFNLLPISLLGFEIYVPMGLFFIPLTFFLILTESAFYIW